MQPVVVAGPLNHVPSPILQVAASSPFRGILYAQHVSPSRFAVSSLFGGTLLGPMNSPVRLDVAFVVDVSSDDAAPPPKLHPYFLNCAPKAPLTHEMRFHAVAASPFRPTGRKNGRLRRRACILPPPPPPPPPQPSPPPPPPPPPPPRSDPGSPPLDVSSSFSSLAVSTPPVHKLVPRLLFPETSPPLTLLIDAQTGTMTSPSSQCSQTAAHAMTQTSPRLAQPLTLHDLRTELRSLLVDMGCFFQTLNAPQ